MFISPMRCDVLREPARLDHPRYVAEPTFDGQRVQVHVDGGRTVAAYRRPGRPLLEHAGVAWLKAIRWPLIQAVLDGRLCGETGHDGIQAVLVDELARVPDPESFDLLRALRAEVLCWGVLPSGRLWHPVFVRRGDRAAPPRRPP
jgi:ATP-dependent DNA ligase